MQRLSFPLCGALALLLLTAGCGGQVPTEALVLTQTPAGLPATAAPQALLDQRYPAGSRVVLALPPFRANDVRVLSGGLVAAGDPVVAPNGKHIYFCGKAKTGDAWQIYQTKPTGGRPRAVTLIEGGAMNPAIIADGNLVFSAPVPNVGTPGAAGKLPALYAQTPGGTPRRLTFGSTAAVAPTVLDDGRILFVSSRPPSSTAAKPNLALFTMNNDGSEVTAFAIDQDGAPLVQRPRQLYDGRIGFLATTSEASGSDVWPETVRTARPFASRTRLFNFRMNRCRSVEPAQAGELLVSCETGGMPDAAQRGTFAIYQLGTNVTTLGAPLFDDPVWNDVEATRIAARTAPMGHISALSPAKQTGTILCLNANFTRNRKQFDTPITKAERVRVLASDGPGRARALGEITLHPDGSFMAEVPADTPLGFESLDASGRVLHRLEPALWVRPGENRSCLGCHEPYNRSARNLRPIAAFFPPVLISPLTVTQKSPPHEKE